MKQKLFLHFLKGLNVYNTQSKLKLAESKLKVHFFTRKKYHKNIFCQNPLCSIVSYVLNYKKQMVTPSPARDVGLHVDCTDFKL